MGRGEPEWPHIDHYDRYHTIVGRAGGGSVKGTRHCAKSKVGGVERPCWAPLCCVGYRQTGTICNPSGQNRPDLAGWHGPNRIMRPSADVAGSRPAQSAPVSHEACPQDSLASLRARPSRSAPRAPRPRGLHASRRRRPAAGHERRRLARRGELEREPPRQRRRDGGHRDRGPLPRPVHHRHAVCLPRPRPRGLSHHPGPVTLVRRPGRAQRLRPRPRGVVVQRRRARRGRRAGAGHDRRQRRRDGPGVSHRPRGRARRGRGLRPGRRAGRDRAGPEADAGGGRGVLGNRRSGGAAPRRERHGAGADRPRLGIGVHRGGRCARRDVGRPRPRVRPRGLERGGGPVHGAGRVFLRRARRARPGRWSERDGGSVAVLVPAGVRSDRGARMMDAARKGMGDGGWEMGLAPSSRSQRGGASGLVLEVGSASAFHYPVGDSGEGGQCSGRPRGRRSSAVALEPGTSSRPSRRPRGRLPFPTPRLPLLRPVLWLLPLALFLFPLAPSAQVRLVEIIGADFVDVTSDSLGTIRTMTGNVRLRQDTTFLQSRRAVYYETLGEVVMDGSVRIVSGRDTLTAAQVTYDSGTKTARASGDVRVGDGESVLFAPLTVYDSRAERSAFEGGGRIEHNGAVLTSPSGTYSSARRVAEFDGPVTLEDSTGVLTAERGTYDARVQRADFWGRVRLRRPDAALDADSVVYFRRTERARAFGRVVLERVGDGGFGADGAPADSSRWTFLFGETLVFDGQAETASARGEPEADGRPARDPLLIVLRADSTGRVDSTLARAPRIDASRTVVGTDTLDVVVAAGGARLWERRLSAVADSARFVRQPAVLEADPLNPAVLEADSLGSARGPSSPRRDLEDVDRLVLRGTRRPSVWADGSQLTGDSLTATARDGTVSGLDVWGRAFAARLDSTLGRLQQIAGGQMAGTFEGDNLRRLDVWPNAEVLYFSATPDGLLNGAYQLSNDSLSFHFDDGDIRDFAGYRGIEGWVYGPSNVPDAIRLPGFAYDPDGAPTRSDLLGDAWEAGWLDAYGPLPPAPVLEDDPGLESPDLEDESIPTPSPDRASDLEGGTL